MVKKSWNDPQPTRPTRWTARWRTWGVLHDQGEGYQQPITFRSGSSSIYECWGGILALFRRWPNTIHWAYPGLVSAFSVISQVKFPEFYIDSNKLQIDRLKDMLNIEFPPKQYLPVMYWNMETNTCQSEFVSQSFVNPVTAFGKKNKLKIFKDCTDRSLAASSETPSNWSFVRLFLKQILNIPG